MLEIFFRTYMMVEITELGSAFLELQEVQILKFFSSVPTMVAPSWVQCMYLSAQNDSGYVMDYSF